MRKKMRFYFLCFQDTRTINSVKILTPVLTTVRVSPDGLTARQVLITLTKDLNADGNIEISDLTIKACYEPGKCCSHL